MERRKDTPYTGTKLPKEYLELVEGVFNKNFKTHFLAAPSGRGHESFMVFGEIYPDEVLLVVSLKHPGSLQMTTCHASVDFPTAGVSESPSVSDQVQYSVNRCVDAAASFFQTFFAEGRPVDYETEYHQGWTTVELEKNIKVYLRVNRDNPELESEADEMLKLADDEDSKSVSKKKVH